MKAMIKRWLLNKLMGNATSEFTLDDGTKLVRMSEDFFVWTYSKGHNLFTGEQILKDKD